MYSNGVMWQGEKDVCYSETSYFESISKELFSRRLINDLFSKYYIPDRVAQLAEH